MTKNRTRRQIAKTVEAMNQEQAHEFRVVIRFDRLAKGKDLDQMLEEIEQVIFDAVDEALGQHVCSVKGVLAIHERKIK